MIKDFDYVEKFVSTQDKAREELIGRVRVVLKASKGAIYSIHRKDMKNAALQIKNSESELKFIVKIVENYPDISSSAYPAFEEYCEAVMFYSFVKDDKVPTCQELKMNPLHYVGGLSDLTGELGRMAVLQATAKNKISVKKIRDFIDEVYGHVIKLDLRNGDVRKKADSIKWNLSKVEELLYDLGRK